MLTRWGHVTVYGCGVCTKLATISSLQSCAPHPAKMVGLVSLLTTVCALMGGQELTAIVVSTTNFPSVPVTLIYCSASVFSHVWHAEVCASGAQPSCPPAGLGHGPPTCGVCRQISEHSYCEDLVQVVANLSGLEPFTSLAIDPAFFEPQGFLRLLAFVETRDGLLLSDCNKGGIWNVNYVQLFNCLSQSSLLSYPYHTEYKFTVSLVDSFTYEDFNCPANSAFAALLLLICNSNPNDPVAAAADLPTERDSFPSFYARYYCHPNCNESGAEMKFREGMQAFEGCTRKKRHLTSPYTSTGSELSWNANTVETAEGLQNSAGVYSFICPITVYCSYINSSSLWLEPH